MAAVTKTREPGFNRCIHPSQSPITLLPGPGSQTAVFSLSLHGAEGCFYGTLVWSRGLYSYVPSTCKGPTLHPVTLRMGFNV